MIQPGIVRRHLRVRCSTVILASFEGGISECHRAFKNGEMILNRPSALLVFRRVHSMVVPPYSVLMVRDQISPLEVLLSRIITYIPQVGAPDLMIFLGGIAR
jgi:hypothetical protein